MDLNARTLRRLPINDRVRSCPAFVGEMVQRAIEALAVERVWLFGSWARGDASDHSDMDLAFEVPEEHRHGWPGFCVDTEEHTRTLRSFDLLRWDTTPEDIRTRIMNEGVVLYERT